MTTSKITYRSRTLTPCDGGYRQGYVLVFKGRLPNTNTVLWEQVRLFGRDCTGLYGSTIYSKYLSLAFTSTLSCREVTHYMSQSSSPTLTRFAPARCADVTGPLCSTCIALCTGLNKQSQSQFTAWPSPSPNLTAVFPLICKRLFVRTESTV